MSQWISLLDAKPPIDQGVHVLISDIHGYMEVAELQDWGPDRRLVWNIHNDSFPPAKDYPFWMPLPEKPT
jgi:hypothetical protein